MKRTSVKRISATLLDMDAVMASAGFPYEIIVVDGKLDLDAQPTEILKAICDDIEAENKVA